MDDDEALGATAEQRGEAVHSLVREASMHSVGEEQLFYPRSASSCPTETCWPIGARSSTSRSSSCSPICTA